MLLTSETSGDSAGVDTGVVVVGVDTGVVCTGADSGVTRTLVMQAMVESSMWLRELVGVVEAWRWLRRMVVTGSCLLLQVL